MTDITEEMVELAAKALYEVEWHKWPESTWEKVDDSERPYWRQSARAALEAVVPMVVKGERARLAKILDGRSADSYIIHDCDHCGNLAARIAGAIRSDTGGE